jgi:hypothetical protein
MAGAEHELVGPSDRRRRWTRACGAVGLLLLVLAWRLDRAVETAYASGWTHRTVEDEAGCADCRLPGLAWLVLHAGAGVAAIGLLLIGLFVWRKGVDKSPTAPLLWLCRVTAVLAFAAALAAAYLRIRAGTGDGKTLLGYAVACDVAALVLLGIYALAVATQADSGAVSARIRRFVQRHGVNLAGVVALVLFLDVLPQTSGQAIDSIRGWVAGDAHGLARLAFGMATTFLLALVVYESSIRLSLIRAAGGDPKAQRAISAAWWFVAGVAVLVGGIVASLFLPIGYGVAVLGGILIALGFFELADLRQSDPPQESVTEAGYEDSPTAENLAIVPLLGVGAIALAGAVDAALSDGANVQLRSLVVLVPGVLFVLGAIFMTRDTMAPAIYVGSQPWTLVAARWLGSLAGVGLLLAALLYANSEVVAAVVGFALLAGLALYAWVLFHASADLVIRRSAFLVVLPVTVWSGALVVVAVHWDVFVVSDVLGVFGLVNIGLASLLASLHYVVLTSLRHRPPRFFSSLGMQQLPLLTLLAVWWIAAGLCVRSTVGGRSWYLSGPGGTITTTACV